MPGPRRVNLPKPDRFDPLKPENIGGMLRKRLEELDFESFPHRPFLGAGLYALYYIGDFPLYAALRDRQIPIYVGKAEAGNSSYGSDPDYDKPKLTNRVEKHAKSVQEVEVAKGNIATRDFRVRALSLEDAWIVLGERALLRTYRPILWNTIMSGFGSNDPGSARTNPRSVWDTIHPGRSRAGELPNRRFTYQEMETRIGEGIAISTMEEGPERDGRLLAFNRRRPPVIWAPAPKKDPDQRIRVADMPRFLGELARLNMDLTTDDYVHTDAPLPDDDREGDEGPNP